MAYIIVSFKDEEIGRWPLNGALSLGRSAECDIAVHDILLSRRHCQIIPYRQGWIAIDDSSKNGTTCQGSRISRRGLADGDVLHLGRTTVRFQIGRLPQVHQPPPKRPADPFEALANTVAAFDPSQLREFQRTSRMPTPRPVPRDPESYIEEDVYSLLSEIASSSWDSIYAEASRPRRPIPRLKALFANVEQSSAATATAVAPRVHRARPIFSEDLQVPQARPQTPLHAAGPVTSFAEVLAPARVVVKKSRKELVTLHLRVALQVLRRWIRAGFPEVLPSFRR